MTRTKKRKKHSFIAYFLSITSLLICLLSCQGKLNMVNNAPAFLNNLNWDSLSDTEQEVILDSLFENGSQLKNSKATRMYLLQLAEKFDEIADDEHFLKLLQQNMRYSKADQDTLSLARTYETLAIYYENAVAFDSSYHYFHEAEKSYKQLNDTVKIGTMAIGKASILYDFGVYTESESEAIRALNYFKNKETLGFDYEAYQLLGLILCELKDFDASLRYYDKTLQILQKIDAENLFTPEDITEAYAALYNNIAGVFELKKEFNQAIIKYEQAFALPGIEKVNPLLYAALLNNHAYSKIKNGSTDNLLANLLKAHDLRDSLDQKHEVIMSKLTLATYYFTLGDTLTGLQYVNTSYKNAKKINNLLDEKEALQQLVQYDLENKIAHTESYMDLAEKIRIKEQLTKDKFARIAYETEEIENRNKQLKLQNTYALSLGALVSVLLLVILWMVRLRFKNKQLHLLNQQQQTNEKIYQLMIKQHEVSETAKTEERQRIAKELHDGIVNRIFTTRFNLMQLESPTPTYKELLISELVKAEEEVRMLSHELTDKTILKASPFQQMAEALILQQCNSFGTTFDVSMDQTIPWKQLNGNQKINLYRIIQETLQNVNKYSQATKCTTLFLKKKDGLLLRIIDNGVGFDTAKKNRGIGLQNIKDRAVEINGIFNIQSTPTQGTQVSIYIANVFTGI